MSEEFIEAIEKQQAAFGVDLGADRIQKLADYFGVVQRHNELLHLVAPSPAGQFATRHILESLTLLEFLPVGARFADVGAGAGLPSIPCLLVRDDLKADLIESKEKKAKFLNEAVQELGLGGRAAVLNRQFEEVDVRNDQFITCRALDKFAEKLPRLLKWSKGRGLLLFGGGNLRDALDKQSVSFREKLMPLSEQRYLFIVETRAKKA